MGCQCLLHYMSDSELNVFHRKKKSHLFLAIERPYSQLERWAAGEVEKPGLDVSSA